VIAESVKFAGGLWRDDQRSKQSPLFLEHGVAVIPVSAGLPEIELVSERLARRDRRIRQEGHAVHGIGQQNPMPVNRGLHVHPVVDANHGVVALGETQARPWQSPRQAEGASAIFVAIDGRAAGVLTVADPVKATTSQALAELRELGVNVLMLTGDNPRTAEAVARKLGIADFQAGVTPNDKHEKVKTPRAAGRTVGMAGDGINDAPALAAADVGIAMGTGTDIAMESAGVTLVKGDLRGIVRAIKLGRAMMRNIRQNLFFAFVYNALGIPVAAGLLYPFFGVLLSPIIAGAAMSLSSVSVIANALRLRKVDL
jgi:cation transport ATPase